MTTTFTRGAAAFIAVMVVLAPDAMAQTARETVGAQLQVVLETKADEGFAPDTAALGRPTLLGVLEHDATVHVELMLEAGREYYIAGRCDTGCARLDTRVLSPEFDPLVEDNRGTDVPNMVLTATASGPHLLAVRMAECGEGICYFGIAVASRAATR